jgi:hypothetical protein
MKTMTFPTAFITWPVRMTIVSIKDRVAEARAGFDFNDRPDRYEEWQRVVDGIVDEAIEEAKEMVGCIDDGRFGTDAVIMFGDRIHDAIMAVVRYDLSGQHEADNPDVEVLRFRGLPTVC